jgi:hypothetical protein
MVTDCSKKKTTQCCSESTSAYHGEDLVVLQPSLRADLERLERIDPVYDPHLALLPVQHVLLGALLPRRCNVELLARRRRHPVVVGRERSIAAGLLGVLIFDALQEFRVGRPCPSKPCQSNLSLNGGWKVGLGR